VFLTVTGFWGVFFDIDADILFPLSSVLFYIVGDIQEVALDFLDNTGADVQEVALCFRDSTGAYFQESALCFLGTIGAYIL